MNPVVRIISADDVRACRQDLAALLADCVGGGASIGFMSPFTIEEAAAWWDGICPAVEAGRTVLFAAYLGGELVGSAQLGVDMPPNQRHRGDVKKVIVHRAARRHGIGGELMATIDAEARRRGRTLLVLDTATGSDAERLYERQGWTRAGTIPDYAMWPDGRLCGTTLMWKRL